MAYTYRVKKRAKEVGDTLVEKHGLCAVFTLRDLNHEMNDATKSIKEADANFRFNRAAAQNVEINNAWLVKFLKGLKPQQMHAATLYFKHKVKADMYEELAKQSRKTLALLKREDKQVRALITKK